MIHSIVDSMTGQLLLVGNFPDEEHVAANTPEGATAVAGQPSNYDHYFQDGNWVAFPPQPSAYHSWNPTSRQWVDARTLAQAQADQIAALAAAYAIAIVQPISFTTAAGVTQSYQADSQSVSNATDSMLGCQAAQSTPQGFYWVAADNTQVPFTYADLQGLAAAFFAQGQRAFVKLQTLKAQVRAATSVDQVTTVVW